MRKTAATRRLNTYHAIVSAESASGTFVVPAGTAELTIIGEPNALFFVNSLRYNDDVGLSYPFRTIGEAVVQNDAQSIRVEQYSSVRVSYSSIENLNGIQLLDSNLQVSTADRLLEPEPPDLITERLQHLINLCEDAIAQSVS